MPSASASDRPKLLLLGDSLTQLSFEGWGGALANTFQRRADVLNRGLNGYNTRWYLKYAEDNGIWEEPGKVALVTLWFGANDAADKAQNVPLDEYASNLEQLVDKAKASYPEAKILLITPPPVHEKQRNAYLKEQHGDKASERAQRTSATAGKYAEACLGVAKTKDVPCLDIFGKMTTADENKDETDVERFFWDGLHFSKAGHDFVAKLLEAALQEHFPNLAVQPCPITGQFNNSGSKCKGIPSSGPYHDSIKSQRTWQEAFD